MNASMCLQELCELYAELPFWENRQQRFRFVDLANRVRFYAAHFDFQAGQCWAIHELNGFDSLALAFAASWQGAWVLMLPARLVPGMRKIMLEQCPVFAVITGQAEASWPIPAYTLPSSVGGRGREGPLNWDAASPSIAVMSSGSTGIPKAIVHSWASLLASAQTSSAFFHFTQGQTWLLSLDLAHIGGLMIAMRCLLAGGICLELAEPKALAGVLSNYRPDFISLVPTQLFRLLQDSTAIAALQAARAILLGGAAAEALLLRKAQELTLPIACSYGSSETAALCAAHKPGSWPSEAGDVGELLPDWLLRSEGERLFLRGPAAAVGIWQSQHYSPLCDHDGCLLLPDRFRVKGRSLTVLGRADQIFQVAGENIAPAEILRPLAELREQADFIVIPNLDPEYGQVPVLIVRSAVVPNLTKILELWQGQISGLHRPKAIYWHQSDEVQKLSQAYYSAALSQGQLCLIWRQDRV